MQLLEPMLLDKVNTMSNNSNCPLCASKVTDHVDYLKNMSLVGKIFRYLPNFFGSLMFTNSLRNRFEHGKRMISVFGSHLWHYCGACNFSYVYPQITPENLDGYYSGDYWSVRTTTDLKDALYSERNTDRPKYQLKFLNGNGLISVDKMLDFGAGMCGAAIVFKSEKFCNDITILDPSSQANAIAGILDIRQSFSFEDVKDSQFDFLYSSHSLEHVQNLRETLERFRAVIKIGGYLCIEVPNIANRAVMEVLHHAPHTYNFSQESLCHAMSLHGFETVDCHVYGVTVAERIKKDDEALDVPESILGLFRKKVDT